MTTTERVGLATGNWGLSGSNFEVESSQVHRQENVDLAARKLGQKDLTRPNSEEDDTYTGPPVAVSPGMRFSNYTYDEKVY